MSDKKKIISTLGLVIVLAFSFLMFFGISTAEKTSVEIDVNPF